MTDEQLEPVVQRLRALIGEYRARSRAAKPYRGPLLRIPPADGDGEAQAEALFEWLAATQAERDAIRAVGVELAELGGTALMNRAKLLVRRRHGLEDAAALNGCWDGIGET